MYPVELSVEIALVYDLFSSLTSARGQNEDCLILTVVSKTVFPNKWNTYVDLFF
jgi:hypothetical protein